MGNYIYYFEVAAVANIVIMLYDMLTKKQYYRDDAKIFIKASVSQILLSLVDILSCKLLEITSVVPLFINVFAVLAYFVLQALTIFYITLFPQAYNCHRIIKKSRLFWVAVILFVANAGLAVSSVFTKYYFYFDENKIYHQGTLANIGYYFYFIMGFGIFVYALNPRKKFLIGERLSLVVSMFIICAGVFMQYKMRDSLITGMVTSISLLLIYVTMENPNSYMDKTSGSGNHEAIRRRMESWNPASDKFAFITIRVDNLAQFEHADDGNGGEDVISKLAEFMKNLVKSRRSVYRLDDCSVSVILPGGRAEIDNVLNQLAAIEDQKIKVRSSEEATLEYSIVACTYPDQVTSFNSFHVVTDYLLDEIKGNVSRHDVVADDEDLKKIERSTNVEKALKKALSNDAIDLFFQPIYDTQKKKISSLETLSRLTDSDLGSIPPYEFITIAEKCGKIEELTKKQFIKTCKFIKEHINIPGCTIENININLSPALLKRNDMVPWLIENMQNYNIPVGMINFEITESATADSPEILAIAIKELMEAGAVFSLDDYGTGYSNILYMANFPFVAIKFDKEMIWSYFEQDVFKTILNKEFELVTELKENIVAEGVETEEQLIALAKKGIRYIQGYYFSSPLSEERILEYLKAPAPQKWFNAE